MDSTDLAPLLAFTDDASATGEAGVVQAICSELPMFPRQVVACGTLGTDDGTEAVLAREHGWQVLTLQAQGIDNVNALFESRAVPLEPACLVLGEQAPGPWAWSALHERYRPALVVLAFDAGVHPRVQAVRAPGIASYAALCALAVRKGYRLIHVHGPSSLYFLRDDLPWPAEAGVRLPLSDEAFALLTRPLGSHGRPLSRSGDQPEATRGAREEGADVCLAPWRLQPEEAPSQRVQLYDLAFEVLGTAQDPGWYRQRKTFEEKASLLYPMLAAECFEQFVDIGANVGFVSLLARRADPALRVLAIEADPRLAALARRNFQAHGLQDAVLVNAAASDRDTDAAPFALNPHSSLDNRVSHAGWHTVQVPVRRCDNLLRRAGFDRGRTFFKVDTQGFELRVLRGLEGVLTAHTEWLLKMEFAPDWLRAQGTDPLLLLDYLMLRYEVAEFPERISYGTPSTGALFAHPIGLADQPAFLAHVESLNGNGLGWVDLIVRPRRR